MFGLFRREKAVSALDQIIFAIYGNPPPPKRANLKSAIALASEELLRGGNVDRDEICSIAEELHSGPIPYSTHDLALSIAMAFFKRPDCKARFQTTQMFARLRMLEWLQEGLVAPMLVQSYEEVLYKLYKP